MNHVSKIFVIDASNAVYDATMPVGLQFDKVFDLLSANNSSFNWISMRIITNFILNF